MEIYRNLLLQTGGDVEEALRWMEHFGKEYGFFSEGFSLEDFKKMLEESGEAQRTPQGFQVTSKCGRRAAVGDAPLAVRRRPREPRPAREREQRGQAGRHRRPDARRGRPRDLR